MNIHKMENNKLLMLNHKKINSFKANNQQVWALNNQVAKKEGKENTSLWQRFKYFSNIKAEQKSFKL